MKSLCIKTNNLEILDYLQNNFSSFDLDNVYYCCKKFKNYNNVIIHYKGIDVKLFYTKLAHILSCLVIDIFEESILKRMVITNYFYFDSFEINKVLDICFENLTIDEEFSISLRQNLLFEKFYNYICNNKSIVITGFVNFRLSEYKELLERVVDISVNEYIIEREYIEFISLLKLYINSRVFSTKAVHLICDGNECILLDENMNLINIDKSSLDVKYLSDISFSNNDYVLNTLLDILPSKIFLHISPKSENLEFIHTLKLIFDDRIEICTDSNTTNLFDIKK